jgi:flagellar FliJ protein
MSNVLQILIEKASEQADDLTRSIAGTQKKLQQGQEKLSMLQNYRDECQSNMHIQSNSGMTGLTGQQLRNQQAFVSKINQALEQQNSEMVFLNSQLKQQHNQWQKTLAEKRKYEALAKREKTRLSRLDNKRDQKMNDEFAARIYRTHTAGESQ